MQDIPCQRKDESAYFDKIEASVLDTFLRPGYIHQRHGGVAKLVYRAGLSSRRSRVRAPSLPQKPVWFQTGFFFL